MNAERDWFKFSMFQLKFQKRIPLVLATPAQTSFCWQKWLFLCISLRCIDRNTISPHLLIGPCRIQSNPMNLLARITRRAWWTPITGTSILARDSWITRVDKLALKSRRKTNRILKHLRLCSSSNASFEVLSTTRSCNIKCLIPYFYFKSI